MQKKIYYLGSCSTCRRIMDELQIEELGFVMQDIKTEKISPAQLDEMAECSGSYESLFSRRAMKFRAMGLHERQLDEPDYRKLILEEYTFLKRPVLLIGERIFVGNSKKTVAQAAQALNS